MARYVSLTARTPGRLLVGTPMLRGIRPLIGATLLGLSMTAVGTLRATGGDGPASVLQHHHGATREGLYVEPALTRAAAARLHRDPAFRVPLAGPTYAQP